MFDYLLIKKINNKFNCKNEILSGIDNLPLNYKNTTFIYTEQIFFQHLIVKLIGFTSNKCAK